MSINTPGRLYRTFWSVMVYHGHVHFLGDCLFREGGKQRSPMRLRMISGHFPHTVQMDVIRPAQHPQPAQTVGTLGACSGRQRFGSRRQGATACFDDRFHQIRADFERIPVQFPQTEEHRRPQHIGVFP